jgi:hypothetical protein
MTTNDAVAIGLREAERRARWQQWLFWGSVAIEALLIAGFLGLADWRNRTHVLLFLSTLGVYYALALAVASLTLRLEECTRRILQGVKLLDVGEKAGQ